MNTLFNADAERRDEEETPSVRFSRSLLASLDSYVYSNNIS